MGDTVHECGCKYGEGRGEGERGLLRRKCGGTPAVHRKNGRLDPVRICSACHCTAAYLSAPHSYTAEMARLCSTRCDVTTCESTQRRDTKLPSFWWSRPAPSSPSLFIVPPSHLTPYAASRSDHASFFIGSSPSFTIHSQSSLCPRRDPNPAPSHRSTLCWNSSCPFHRSLHFTP